MKYIVEKIGMSRTTSNPSIAVTLFGAVGAKICEAQEGGEVLVAYPKGKTNNKYIVGMREKYNLPAEFNKSATLEVANTEVGNLDKNPLNEAKILKISFNSKGRGYSGVMKGRNFGGGPTSHGSRFHRRHGPIGSRRWPGRVQPGMKMAGRYGNAKVSVKNELVSYDMENEVLVLKGAVPGFNGAMGRVKIAR